MAFKSSRNLWMMIIYTFSVMILNTKQTLGKQEVPCYFIFGDSLLDNGNNNNLNTTLKANYFPYGIDFPGGVVTGRFTNGRTMGDIIGTFPSFFIFFSWVDF